MAMNLAQGSRPSLSADELRRMAEIFPGDVSTRLANSQFVAADGRQEFPHFWFYPLLASPFVAVALALGAHPIAAFTALNILLLLVVAALLGSRASAAVSLLLCAGPILWWVDKAHTEVFTFSLLVIAILLLRPAPWWSIAALGAAATQNPPLAAAMAVAMACAAAVWGWRDRRIWLGTAAGVALASLHPIYYYARLDVWSGLRRGVDWHWPSIRELATVLVDPNLGIFIHAPFFAAAAGIALIATARQAGRRLFDVRRVSIALIGALFLVSFTQTTNFNSGGTPAPSRYGLWLLPLAVPLFEGVPATAVWLRLLSVASVVWCSIHFAPHRPDEYLKPTWLAATVWQRWPDLDNPLAEVFGERIAGVEPAHPPLATAGCEKVLLVGNGVETGWPERCIPAPAPGVCREAGAMCYANRAGAAYRFSVAPTSPAWRRQQAALAGPRPAPIDAIAVAPPPRGPADRVAIWMDDGWSYLEGLPQAPSGRSVQWRWISADARVGVLLSDAARIGLKISARALNRPRRLRLTANGSEVITFEVSPTAAEYQTPPFQLGAGTSYIYFNTLDGADTPGGGDERRLSVAVYRLEMVRF